MRYMIAILYCLIGMLLASCAAYEEEPQLNASSSKSEPYEVAQTVAEDRKGDFIYRLATEKAEYKEHGDVKIYAELEYVGDKDEITIYHAASPIYFPMTEKTRGYRIEYMMNQPLLSTTLEKGEILREEYTKSGGYSSQDDEEYINFIEELWEKGFPAGFYVVNGSAQFHTIIGKEGEEKKEDYILKGEVQFWVK